MKNIINSPNDFLGEKQGKDTHNAQELTPEFDELNAEKLVNGVRELVKQSREEKELKENKFPVEIFPTAVQQIITATNESLNYPVDFIGASLLYAVSIAIGNTHKAEIKKGYNQSAVLYMVLVGRAGTNKSHPLSWALRPIEERDKLEFQNYQKEKKEYDAAVKLQKKEKEEQGIVDLVQPIWKQILVTDFTPEALTDVHKFNSRGIGVYADELSSWIYNFDRYNKGSAEQFWLMTWSGTPIRINRKTSDPIYIPVPFIGVAGTIQPSVLNELAKKRTENGFFDRLLFVIPDDLKKEYWSEKDLNPSVNNNWRNIINNLLSIPIIEDDSQNPKPEMLQFTAEAKQHLVEWQKEITDASNESENEVLAGTYAKIEPYAIRLALCLQMMRHACKESDKDAIDTESVQGAIRLAEYFKNSAVKVHSLVSNSSPLDKLSVVEKRVYKKLPGLFSTGQGIDIALETGMPDRTFSRFLNKSELFIRVKQGKYQKTVIE